MNVCAKQILILISALIFIPLTVLALPKSQTYYGDQFYKAWETGGDIRVELRKVLLQFHIPQKNQNDKISIQCPQSKSQNQSCYKHKVLSYHTAREYMFGQLDLNQDKKGLWVQGVYCEEKYRNEDFPEGAGIGPGRIPSASVINTEHTWPQSRFSRNHSSKMQKADLHALFPTKSDINSKRGKKMFAEVLKSTSPTCKGTKMGRIDTDKGSYKVYFEPPESHRGNIARALFYFAFHYDLNISAVEEGFLRKWHLEDPIDEKERLRNERIFEIQKTRNPFVDYPELVDNIEDF